MFPVYYFFWVVVGGVREGGEMERNTERKAERDSL